MTLDQFRDSIRAAYKMSRAYGKPVYVYRRASPYVVTLDKKLAEKQGEFTRCDAAERLEEEFDADALYW